MTAIRAGGGVRETALAPSFGVIVEAVDEPVGLGDLDGAFVWARYRAAGAVLLRRMCSTVDEFARFAGQFIAERMTNGSPMRADVLAEQRVQTVNTGDQPIALHAEMAYSPMRPDLLFFFCQVPPSPGSGETLLADGVELWRGMDAGLRSSFEGRLLKYTYRRNRMLAVQCSASARRFQEHAGVRHCQWHEDGTLDLDFVAPPVVAARHVAAGAFANSVIVEDGAVSFADGAPVSHALRHELFAYTTKTAVPVAWDAGDVLMVDNSRIMHGRRRIRAADGRAIAIQMGWERGDVDAPR
jgi:alpha-ketoglutarate-dependent taurine dioxygenase